MCSVVAPIGKEARCIPEWLSQRGFCLTNDTVDNPSSAIRRAVGRQYRRFIPILSNSNGQKDRLSRRAAHRAAGKMISKGVAGRSLRRTLEKCGTEFVGEFTEQFSNSVRTANQNLIRLFVYPKSSLRRDCVTAAVRGPLATQELYTGSQYTPATQFPCSFEKYRRQFTASRMVRHISGKQIPCFI